MRFLLILLLSCQPYFAVSLLYSAVPSVLRQNGASLQTLGLFGLVFFAFTVNFLWAPLVDRRAPAGIERRRFWLVATQIGSGLLFVILAVLDPARNLAGILIAGMLLAAFAATQRSVILGFSADVLGDAEKPWGATAFGWGTAVGNIIGGSLALLLVQGIGWTASLAGLAAISFALLPVLMLVKGSEQRPAIRSGGLRIIANRNAWAVMLALAPATFGLAVAFAMTQPRLVDLGFDLTSIGLAAGLGNLVAATLAGPLAGWLGTRTPLGTLMAGGPAVIAVITLGLLGATRLTGEWGGALASVVVIFSAICALGVISNTVFLKIAGDGDAAATEVTFLSAVMSLVALAGFMASGFIAATGGYGATLAAAATGCALTAGLICLPWPRASLAAREI
ncbi:MFS transporter [Neorhizobium sp. NCHU2750]|uniref:MFS transporter n=1 Tax=Neorhizobium sp. NCHU2750 TaxID=1825976 RepID=UPI000E75B9D0|nr:hypothetical protein NCHU2750_42030 [Neorhizobium sp. NCHU2750]